MPECTILLVLVVVLVLEIPCKIEDEDENDDEDEPKPRAFHTSSTRGIPRLGLLHFFAAGAPNTSSMCFFTVDSVMPRMTAMSEFVLPWAAQSSASAARGVNPSFSKGSEEEKSGLNSRCAC